ncbi:MAG: carboxypeptidase-like regulatory domain-containing protein [Bacteroidota bacterium]
MKSIFLFFWSILLPWYVSGQLQQLEGNIRNASNGDPVAYATVQVEGEKLGAVSNAAGAFSLSIPQNWLTERKILRIASIGFATQKVQLSPNDTQLEISLKEAPFTLATVYIYSTDLSARQLVKQVFKRIADNYPSEPYLLHTFYRHYCMENGAYGRLIEAAVDVYDRKGYNKLYAYPSKKVGMQVRQLRRSFDFTSMSFRRHLPIALNTTLLRDRASYESPLSRNLNNKKFSFAYTDTTIFDGDLVYEVSVAGKTRGRKYKAKVYIHAGDLAFIRTEESYAYVRTKDQNRFIRSDEFATTYRKRNGKYYLDHILNQGQLYDQSLGEKGEVLYSEDHYHRVELMTNAVETENAEPLYGKQPSAEELAVITYDPGFWDNYNVLKATPLENNIAVDLAKRMPLKQQFDQFGKDRDNPQLRDILANIQYRSLLRRYRGQVVLVAVWDSEYSPGLRELLLARKLIKSYKNDPIAMIFLSTDPTDAMWREAVRKKKLKLGSHLRVGNGLSSPLLQQLGVNKTPYFLLINREGEVVLRGDKLPPAKDIQRELDAALKP